MRMIKLGALGVVVALSLSGCASVTAAVNAAATTISTSSATAQKDLQIAINAYGVVKGMAGVATVADPALIPTVTQVEAVLDPLVATAQTALNDATTDATTLESEAQTIVAQATALETSVAGTIKVVPSK